MILPRMILSIKPPLLEFCHKAARTGGGVVIMDNVC